MIAETTRSMGTPPRSLEDLNQRLMNCQPQGSFHSLGLPNLDSTNIKIQTFLERIRYPLQSYQDLNPTQLKLLGTHLFRLFPNQTLDNQERESLQHFWKQVKLFQARLNTTPKVNPTPLQVKDLLEANTSGVKSEIKRVLPKVMDELPTDLILAMALSQYKMSADQRLKKMLLYSAKQGADIEPEQEKAFQLQQALSFLYFEDQLFKFSLDETLSGLNVHHVKQNYEKDNTTVRINASTEVFIMELDNEPLDTAEWAFMLQYEKLLLSKVQLSRYDIKELINHLGRLVSKISESDSKLKTKIVQLIWFFEYENILSKYLKNREKLIQFIEDYKGSHLGKIRQPEIAELTTPFASILIYFIKKHITDGDDLINFETYQSKCKIILSYYRTIRSHQKELFICAQNALEALIQTKTKKEKIQWLSYTKNLALTPSWQQPKDVFDPQFYESSIISHDFPDLAQPEVEPVKATPLPSASSEKETRPTSPENKKGKTKKEEIRPGPNLPISPLTPVLNELNELSILDPLKTAINPLYQEETPLPGLTFPYEYDERVVRWFNHPFHSPLPEEIFGNYAAQELSEQFWKHIRHGFSPLADRFYNLGLEQKWNNPKTGKQETIFIIPVELTIPAHPVFRGVAVYDVNEEGICYHRYLHQLDERIILEKMIKEAFHYNDFPDLKLTNSPLKKRVQAIQVTSEESVKIDPLFGHVTITNQPERMTLKLFTIRPYLQHTSAT